MATPVGFFIVASVIAIAGIMLCKHLKANKLAKNQAKLE